MSSRALRAMCLFVVLLFVTGGGALLAEVSADRSGDRRVTTLLMDLRDDVTGMTDGADPIPNVRWNPYRRLPEPRLLNRSGAIREDGRPDVGFYPHIFTPVVVWAWNWGSDHDIAIAQWTPEGWSETHFLTNERTRNEVDPRIFVDRTAGLHVVWAVEGDDPHIVYMQRQETGEWRTPIRVTPPGEVARRPTVATVGGILVVAYEREVTLDGTLRHGVVVRQLNQVATENGDLTSFDLNHVFPAPRADDLQPILHVRGGRLWLDWKHADGHFGWSVFEDRAWSGVHLHSWLDPSWVGAENARQSIERLVLSPKIPDPFE